MESTVVYQDGMAFEAELDGHRFMIDADPKVGGRDLGPKPKGLVLTALVGCTAMDVISILHKMRIEPTRFSVRADTDLAEDHPKVFTGVKVVYELEGDDLPEKKVRRAVDLSTTRYCAVNAMLGKATSVTHEIWINGAKLADE